MAPILFASCRQIKGITYRISGSSPDVSLLITSKVTHGADIFLQTSGMHVVAEKLHSCPLQRPLYQLVNYNGIF
jgi:hypothetical protein